MEIFVRPSRYELDQAGAMQLLKDSQSVIAEYLGDEFTQFTPDNPGSFDTLWADATRQVVEQDLSESEVVRLMSAVCNYFVMTHKLFNPQQKADISLVVQVSAINEFRFLALPGEVLVEVGLDWKARHLTVERQAFIVGLANGFVGYLPHPSNFNELGAYQMIETLMNALEPAAIGQALKESEAISRKLLT